MSIRTFALAAASLAILTACGSEHDTSSTTRIVSIPENTSLAELSFAAELRSAGSEAERRRVEAKINRLDRALHLLHIKHQMERNMLALQQQKELKAAIAAADPGHDSQTQVQSPLQPNAAANATIEPLSD